MKIAICIITSGRKALALRTVARVARQLLAQDCLILVENGQRLIGPHHILQICGQQKLKPNQIRHFFLPKQSIPAARNFGFNLVKNEFDAIIYFDDDCRPHSHWLAAFRSFLSSTKNGRTVLIQGQSISVPIHNSFTIITQSLFTSWLKANLDSSNHLTLADTKNLAIRLKKVRHLAYLFDERLSYATDIEMWCRLESIVGKTIYLPAAQAFHLERLTFASFFSHRARLSKAFRQITKIYPGKIKASSLANRVHQLSLDTHHLPLTQKLVVWALFTMVGSLFIYQKSTQLFQK